MQKLPQVTQSVKVAHKPPVEQLARFSDALRAREEELAGQGRLLFRYSGTEAKARITVEGPDWFRVREIADELERILLKDIEKWAEQNAS